MYGPFEYYLSSERGVIPEWGNAFAVMSWPEWLGFDALKAAAGISQPVLMVHSEDRAIPEGAKLFFDSLETPKAFI